MEDWLAHAPAYDGTVFLSYARADDEKPPFDDSTHGWVTFFWNQLRFELTNAGVHQATLWLDRYQIDPAEDFTEKIAEALKNSKVMVPILSPNWVQRPFCLQEFNHFCRLGGEEGRIDDIVPVIKLEPPLDRIPDTLRNREGYRFFAKDTAGKVREFYWRGLQDREAYFDILKRMSDWIARRLIELGPTELDDAPPRPGQKSRVIFVAVSADELSDARQRLVNDLMNAGFSVVPPENRMPDTIEAAKNRINELIVNAEMAIHPLGESEGVKPEGGDESITRLQLRVAREHAGKTQVSFPRLLWAPKWIASDPDKKRDPFEVINRFGGQQKGEEIYAEEVTNLSQWLRSRLIKSNVRNNIEKLQITTFIVGASESDDEYVATLANQFQSSVEKVRAIFFGESIENHLSGERFVIIIPWGSADRPSVDKLLGTLSALSANKIVLKLPGGDGLAKRRFFVDGVYAEKLDAMPACREEARTMIIRLVAGMV